MSWIFDDRDWDILTPGTTITMVKRHVDGEERARYPGEVRPTLAESPWVEIEAIWTLPRFARPLLTFEPGDILREFYSWQHPYNAFSVFTPSGEHKGWYANVTCPSFIEQEVQGPVLVWHDLLLDVIANAAGDFEVLDEDELEESGLAHSDPDLHQRIVTACEAMIEALRNRTGPFVASAGITANTHK
jgi:hypothetical protein